MNRGCIAIDEKQIKRLQSKKKLGMLVVALVVLAVLALAYYYTEGTNSAVGNQVVLAVCAEVSPAQQAVLAARLTEYAPPDDRGAVTLRVFSFPQDYADPQGAQLAELIAVMNAGDPNLYLLDRQLYQLVSDRVELSDLSARYPGNPALADGRLYSAAAQPFARGTMLEQRPVCYFALQREDTHAVTKDAQTQEYYKYQLAILDNIVYDRPGAPHTGIFG